MRNASVIEFPKAQSVRKRLQDKAQEQKAVLVLSIASVLIMSVFLNQWLVQGPETLTTNGNRGVASIESAALAKDVKWEQDLAKKLASDKNAVAGSLAVAPTLRDELIFGFLEGRYGMKLAQGKIESLEFIDAQAGDQPMAISDKAEFLTKYSEAFGIGFDQVSLAQNSAEGPVYSLISESKEIVGRAQFVTDEQGRVSAINFTQ
ncbi:hypothetical protein AZI87_16140 [Bdellovibrio bacteriovorus]|uniref:Uncharacterized protein n=1 Tax=Bdellovibrio bacteriovorus TaxID=959 RepID=A0A161PA98_BDEBC|nr:hypothetical protein [Bdellovibrio bacteriovorus]KYG62804.1 hypothetical protein AZI87_16140 [Bdellovibrio bacteriovorus]